MRLLHHDHDGELVLTAFDDYEQPAYTILSHTWGKDEEEVSFADLMDGGGKDKLGYNKIRLCGEQTRRDGFHYFWVDTCCIDKSDKVELSLAIRSMFRWYQDAAKCYVYLSDVSAKKRKLDGMLTETTLEHSLTSSRWFTRGWTLQELLAPSIVELFSQEWKRLGDKTSLGPLISKITGIPQEVLQGYSLAQFDISERLRWRGDRKTKLKEDMAYSLSGICDVDIAPLYGEGEEEAFKRLHKEVQKLKDCLRDLRQGDPKDDKKRIEETKGGLLVDSYRWVLSNDAFQRLQRDPQTQLLWVKGDPGKGKTMLLCGIIDELRMSMPNTTLLSYFFCQATFSHLNSATAVLRGLLYMLITQQPLLASHIYKRHDHAGKRLFEDANSWVALTDIWVDVLRDPGLRMGYLLIDALDECTTDRSKLLRFIAMQSSSSSRLKWVVSSRNWPEIERSLDPAAGKVPLSLELNAHSISAAVKTFINIKVSRLAEEARYDEQTRKVMSEYLSANANDTFLWVALVCQHLKGIAKRHVMKKLNSIPLGLTPFYERMLSGISESEDAGTCRCVLATTAILLRPVVIQELTAIVEPLEEFADDLETVREIVELCGSFLTVKEDTVYFVHQSARDFLFTNANDEIFPYGIDIAHQEICRRSLAVLSLQLHRDMYKLEAPDAFIDDAQPPDPDPLVALRYSCVYWIDHLCNSKSIFRVSHAGSNLVTDEVMLFVKERYLYWLESLGLCRSTTKGVLAMKALSSLAEETSDKPDLIDLLKDANRFFIHNKSVIERYPLQTYASALLFSPRGSLIRTAFQHEELSWITIQPDISETWDPCLHTFEERCSAVAFSHNSNHLALALTDGTIKIWDADSGIYLPTFENHKTEFCQIDKVRFYHDSARLAVISEAHEMIKVWDVATGTYLSTWKYDRKILKRKIPFCRDEALRAFSEATIRASVRIFDTVEAKLLSFLTSPHHDVNCEVESIFSDSGRFLAVNFGSNIKIWDATSSRHIQSLQVPVNDNGLKPNPVTSACISDSMLLVSGFYSGMVMVFSIDSGNVLHVLGSRVGFPHIQASPVAISHDLPRVALSGSSGFGIWDLSDDASPRTLNRKEHVVMLDFSHDSKRLASRSENGRTKIWDIRGEDCSKTLDDHQLGVDLLTFSNDSKYLASGASDGSVKIWDIHGKCLHTLRGHSARIIGIDFTHHPTRVGSLLEDGTYRIWDTTSEQRLLRYRCSSHVVAFSPDARILARQIWVGRIDLWSVVENVCLLVLEVDKGALVCALAFSNDSIQLAVLMEEHIKIYHTGSGEWLQTLDAEYRVSGLPGLSLNIYHTSVAFSNNATRLASAWNDGTIQIWDRNSGRCLHNIKGVPQLSNVSFDQTGQFLLTDHGRIVIPASSDLEGFVAPTTTRSSGFHGIGLSLDLKWITYNSENVLWLPLEYRPSRKCSVISGNSVGVGAGRRVWIFTLSPECLG